MKYTHQEYDLVAATTIQELTTMVQKQLHRGWKVEGGPTVIVNYSSNNITYPFLFLQAITRQMPTV